MITTILTITYLAIAYFIDSCTMKAIKQDGIPTGSVVGYETSLRVGVLI